jgi:hypothetical protein
MKLPLGLGHLDFEEWGLGLVSAFISGGANAVTAGFAVGITDPKDFNLADPMKLFKVMLAAFIVSGFLSMMNFLRSKPVPDKIIEHTVQTVEKPQGTTVVTTVKETRTEPAAPVAPKE